MPSTQPAFAPIAEQDNVENVFMSLAYLQSDMSNLLERIEKALGGRTDRDAEVTKALAHYALAQLVELDRQFSFATRNGRTN